MLCYRIRLDVNSYRIDHVLKSCTYHVLKYEPTMQLINWNKTHVRLVQRHTLAIVPF